MARYGALYKGNLDGNTQGSVVEFRVKASDTVTKGDFVKIAAGGILPATTGDKILGVAAKTVTNGASGTAAAPVYLDPSAIYECDADGTLVADTHVGTYFDITGATGAQLVDQSTTDNNSGQLLCIGVNPTGREATIIGGHYVIAESQLNAYTVDAA